MQTCTRSGPKPRAQKDPSPRDQQIFADYHVTGLRQTELAGLYDLSQCRISQIIRRVTAWRLTTLDTSYRQASPSDELRLSRWIRKERINLICKEAIRHLAEPQTVVTTRSVTRQPQPEAAAAPTRSASERSDPSLTRSASEGHDPERYEKTVRTGPVNVQFLKVLLAANRQLHELDELPPVKDSTPPSHERIMEQELLRLRKEAEAEGRVERSTDPWALVNRWLDALVGESNPVPSPTEWTDSNPVSPNLIQEPPTTTPTSTTTYNDPESAELQPGESLPSSTPDEETALITPTPPPAPKADGSIAAPAPALTPPTRRSGEETLREKTHRHIATMKKLATLRGTGLPYMLYFDTSTSEVPPYTLDETLPDALRTL